MTVSATQFVLPRQDVSLLRAGARWARRYSLRRRRDMAAGEARKLLNLELNRREFWHGRLVLESYPRVVQVGTNWTCNLKCNFCSLTMPWTQSVLKKKPPRELSISPQVEEVVKRILPYAEMLTLTPLGEPLMWSGLTELLDLHAKLGSNNLALTTNGMLLNDKMAEKLVRGQLTHLFVSIDSNDPEVFAGMRVGGNLKTIEEGIGRINAWKQRLGTDRPRLTLNSTFMERNIRQLPSMVEWSQRLGFGDFSVQLMEIENPEQEGEFLGHHVDLAHRMVREALSEARRLGMNVKPHLAFKNMLSAAMQGHDVEHHDFKGASPRLPDEKKKYKEPDVHGFNGTATELESDGLSPELDMRGKTLVEKCHYPWYFLLIDTDGQARPCCWASTQWANLDHSSFEEAWNGPAAQLMRKRFLENEIPESCRGKHCRVDL